MFPWFKRMKPHLIPLFIIGGIAFAAAMAFVFGIVVMALWNWLMPEIFGLTTITYWQAWGFVLLAHILFKTGNHPRHPRGSYHDDSWKDKFRKKFYHHVAKEDEPDTPEAQPDQG